MECCVTLEEYYVRIGRMAKALHLKEGSDAMKAFIDGAHIYAERNREDFLSNDETPLTKETD